SALFRSVLSLFCSAFGAPLSLASFPTRRSSDLTGRHHLDAHRGDRDIHREHRGHDRPGGDRRYEGGLEADRRWSACRYGCLCRRSEEHTSELQSRFDLVCRLLLEKKKRTCDETE